jgi:hypothetical protein
MSEQRITIGGFSLPLPGPHLPVIVVIDEMANEHDQHGAHPGSGPFDLLEEILRQGRIQFTKSDLIALLGDEPPEHPGRDVRLQRRDGDPW